MKAIYDEKYHFASSFDSETGLYYRTGMLDGQGMDTGTDPFMASFPQIVDVGIMGHCLHGRTGLCLKAGVQCYQSGAVKYQENMRLEDFKRIADECEGRTFQFALGGRGDPDLHEDFVEILKYSRSKGIVPNMTTSGFGLIPETAGLIKEYCGAAAVSWYRSDYTLKAIEMLLDAGVRTNIHYVIGNTTIDEAIERIENDTFPKGVNRIIFLLHKPIGAGVAANTLNVGNIRVRRFFGLFNETKYMQMAGFDSCSVPALLQMAPNVSTASMDTCEGARFSAYIASDMTMVPCSFDQDRKWGVDLRGNSMEEAWNSREFGDFRDLMLRSCPGCGIRENCLGGCPIKREIVLCESASEVHGFENKI